MNKTLKIIRREYIEIVRKKSFIIGLFLVPVLIAASLFVPILLMKVKVAKQQRVAVIDRTGDLYASFVSRLDGELDDGRPEYLFRNASDGDRLEARRQDLVADINAGDLDAYIFIPEDIYETGEAEYCGKSVSDVKELGRLRNALTESVVASRLAEQGLDPEAVRRWTRRVDLKTIKIVKGKEKRGGFGQDFFSSFVFAMMLYAVIIGYGMMVMRGVMEEKTSRMVEVLLSSVSPLQMMVGKILGIGAASLTQVAVWMGVAALAAVYGGVALGRELPFSMEVETVLFFGVFFVLGYFLYATLYAVIGAICDSEQDAQQIQMVVIFPLVIPLLLITFIASHPNATASVVLSMVPVFAPMLMFIRINVLTPPAVQIAGSILILVATIAATMWAAARIYRIGILMRGKRATLAEIARWVRYG